MFTQQLIQKLVVVLVCTEKFKKCSDLFDRLIESEMKNLEYYMERDATELLCV